jgi:proline iminopeptidase
MRQLGAILREELMNRRKFLLQGGALAGGLAASARAGWSASSPLKLASETVRRGEVQTGGTKLIPVRGGKYHVWVKRVGEGPIKVLLLHGGPGFNHTYFWCFEDFLPAAGIEFYYYDQLGSLFSDNPNDPKLWTVEGYTDEVEDVRRGLGLENYYLYGQSWGGMLTYEYALKYPKYLRGIVISNMVASIPEYVRYINKLRGQFPTEIVKKLEEYEAKRDYDAPEYQQIVLDQLYRKYVCRLDPWPAPLEVAMNTVNAKIYNTMQGPNEFVVTGTFKNWDRTNDVHRIKTPALLMGARYDEMDSMEIRRISSLMPNAKAVISDRGSHLSMYDDQDWYFRELISFLKNSA